MMELFVFFLSSSKLILICEHARQRGTEDVMNYLSKEALNEKVNGILFLMPCHATPYYSTLHRNLTMRFLDRSPRFGRWQFGRRILSCHAVMFCRCIEFISYFGFEIVFNSEEKGILDESDCFMLDPVGFASELAKNWTLPSHIVLFDSEERRLREFLIANFFKEVDATFLPAFFFF